MKVKELIRQLQELDPTGEVEVFAGGRDILFAEHIPWYYDGKPNILIRDESKKNSYNIKGMRQITEKDGSKICLHTIGLEDVVYEDEKEKNIYEGNEEFLIRVEKYRTIGRKIHFDVDLWNFKGFCDENFKNERASCELEPSDMLEFFTKYEKQLRRSDFNSLGSSIYNKKCLYYKDCVTFEDGELKYIEGFENKDYNNLPYFLVL